MAAAAAANISECTAKVVAPVNGSNQESLSLRSIILFKLSDSWHDYQSLRDRDDAKLKQLVDHFSPQAIPAANKHFTEEQVMENAQTLVGINTDEAAYTCHEIRMTRDDNDANGEALYTVLAGAGIIDPVFIVDVIKSILSSAIASPPAGGVLKDNFPVYLQSASTLCDPGPKMTPNTPAGRGLFEDSRLKWGYSDDSLLYLNWADAAAIPADIPRNLKTRDQGPDSYLELSKTFGLTAKAYQIILQKGGLTSKAATVIQDPNQPNKVYFLEKEDSSKEIKMFRNSAFLNGLKARFTTSRQLIQNFMGSPTIKLNDLNLAASVLAKLMGDGGMAIQASQNNLSWIDHNSGNPGVGGTAGLATYDRNCASSALERGAPFVIHERNDGENIIATLFTRNAFQNPLAIAENLRLNAASLSEKLEVIATNYGQLAQLVGEAEEHRTTIADETRPPATLDQDSYKSLLTEINNSIPILRAITDVLNSYEEMGKLLTFEKLTDLIGKLKTIAGVNLEELNEELAIFVTDNQPVIQAGSAFNRKFITTGELANRYDGLRSAGASTGDKIIAESIEAINIDALVAPAVGSARTAARQKRDNLLGKLTLRKRLFQFLRRNNTFLNDATLLTGSGSVVGPLYRMLININNDSATELIEYSNALFTEYQRQAITNDEKPYVDVFTNAINEIQATVIASADGEIALGGGGTDQQKGGALFDISKEFAKAVSSGEMREDDESEKIASQINLHDFIITLNGILSSYELALFLESEKEEQYLSGEEAEDFFRVSTFPELAGFYYESLLSNIEAYFDTLYGDDIINVPEEEDVEEENNIEIFDNKVLAIQSLSYQEGALRPLVYSLIQNTVLSREVQVIITFLNDSEALQALAQQTRDSMDQHLGYIEEQRQLEEQQRRAFKSAAYAKAERETPQVSIREIQKEARGDGGEDNDDPREGQGRKSAKQIIQERYFKKAQAKRDENVRNLSRKYQRMASVAAKRGFPVPLGSGGDEAIGFSGGKRRTMKNKSKSKRNPKNQTHRKRKGKLVGKRTATAHRPKTARNAKKITKNKKSNTKTQRSAKLAKKPAKKRAINRRARNARKDRK
jgi:hypothetical protein